MSAKTLAPTTSVNDRATCTETSSAPSRRSAALAPAVRGAARKASPASARSAHIAEQAVITRAMTERESASRGQGPGRRRAVHGDDAVGCRQQLHQRLAAPDTQQHTQGRATGRQQQPFGQQLSKQAAAAGANRTAQRELVAARQRAAEHHVRDCPAPDRQQQGDQRGQQPQRLLKPAPHTRKAGVGRHQFGLASQVPRAVLRRCGLRRRGLEQLRPCDLQRRVGFGQREPVLDAAHDVQPGRAHLLEDPGVIRAQTLRQRHRHGQLGRQARSDAEEPTRRDADDGHRRVLDQNGAADDAAVATESLLPRAVAQHRRPPRARRRRRAAAAGRLPARCPASRECRRSLPSRQPARGRH